MRDFKTLDVWKKSHELTLDVYRETAGFPIDERYGLTSQIRRASVSIASNLAEGCGRGSQADYLRFVHMAAGSATEVECQLLISRDLGYLEQSISDELDNRIQQIKRMLSGLIRSLGGS